MHSKLQFTFPWIVCSISIANILVNFGGCNNFHDSEAKVGGGAGRVRHIHLSQQFLCVHNLDPDLSAPKIITLDIGGIYMIFFFLVDTSSREETDFKYLLCTVPTP